MVELCRSALRRRGRRKSTNEGRAVIATAAKVRKKTKKKRTITVRSPAIRELAWSLATLGHRRFRQGHPLNVRRREKVRRCLAEAGEELGWDEVVALDDDPVDAVTHDVKKMLRSGVRLLTRSVEEELAEKKKETRRLEKTITQLEKLAEDPEAFPAEVEYAHTARKIEDSFPTKIETLSLNDPDEALKAAKKLRKSLPRWDKFRKEAVEDLQRRKATLGEMGRNLSDVVEGWRGLLKEVVLVIP